MSLYMPGAVQRPQPGGVTLDTSLPPRFIWHITWDKLNADGTQPDFSAVADYLIRMEYCPHIMWNPFTGYMEQYYPADVGGRALAFNNQDGAAAVQVEVFFTPGCVVDGVRYDTVADTPLIGWEDLLAWGESLGVPPEWPLGSPQWQGNSRDAATWNSNAGHYGHCHSPGDTHTDPGPMPALTGSIAAMGTTTQEDLVPNANDKVFKDIDGNDASLQDYLLSLDRQVKALGSAVAGIWSVQATDPTDPKKTYRAIDYLVSGATRGKTNAAAIAQLSTPDVRALAAELAPHLTAATAQDLVDAIKAQWNK